MQHLPQTEAGQDEMEDKIALNEVSSYSKHCFQARDRLDLNHR